MSVRDSGKVRAEVWSTTHPYKGRVYRLWHYRVYRPDGRTVLYDNTGAFQPILEAALIRVEALRHMIIAGHKLHPYKDGQS